MARSKRGKTSTSGKIYVVSGIMLAAVAIFFAAFILWTDEQYERQMAGYTYTARHALLSFHNSSLSLVMLFDGVIGALGILSIILGLYYRKKERRLAAKIRGLTGEGAPARDFLAHRGMLRQSDFTGVYVLHNKTKDMYYVGQSIRVIDRVGQHLTGHGNGDVYADFKYGDEFEVSAISLAESGYGSLNDLERDTITAYNAYGNGYNRTAGNAR